MFDALRREHDVSKQRGQAIPLGIAAMLFSAALILVLFNTGQMTSEKMRLANTADAAAYSGMVWQARSLNFQAYTNRAMVANQVAIAQFVSLVSWSKYLYIGARNFDYVGSFIWFLKPFSAIMLEIATAINEVMEIVANVAIPIIDTLIEVLSASQTVVHYAAAATTWDIVQEVVRQNDPQYGLTANTTGFLALNAARWLNFTEQYNQNAMLTRMQDVTMRSRDGFSGEHPQRRGWTLRGPNLGLMQVRLVKGGDTRLLSDGDAMDRSASDLEWEWKAKDTLSIHTRWRCPTFRNPGRWCNQEIPMAWGEAYASTTDDDFCNGSSSTANCGSSRWTENRRAEQLADWDDPISLDGYGGIRPYRDIAGLNEDEPDESTRDPRLGLAVEVYKAGNNVRTSTVAGVGSPSNPVPARNGIGPGMFRLNDNFAGGEMSSISKAEVFFRRPDGRLEYANLFNPYWDVHLISSRTERIAAWALKGILDFTGAVGGGGSVPGL